MRLHRRVARPVRDSNRGQRPFKGREGYRREPGGGAPADRASGDRSGLRRAAREINLFDSDDRRWLRGRPAPQGRLNAGQKLNAAVTAAFAVLFALTGFLLWYGEQNTRFRFPGTVALHDALTYLSVVIVVGHLYLAVLHPATRHALRGITFGSVREDWAREHHAKWADSRAAPASPPEPE